MSGAMTLEGISKRFGSLEVLRNVSIEVKPGERCGIIGPNGAGKSTLFNIIAGELAPTSGNVALFGRDVTALGIHTRAQLGLSRTFQTTTLFPRLNVLENMLLALYAHHAREHFQCIVPRRRLRHREEEARALLARVELDHRAEAPVSSLGYGERRQLELLLAIAQRPRILLLDEPTAGLAPGDTSLVTEMLKREQGETTIILIEHDMGVVFDVVERLVVLHHGRVVADGPLEEIRADDNVQEIYLGGKV
ncbi:MAG TPA: ABC transporter ATP-binding protein [Candidatus Binatia bacterium]|nr:ABC transporter ATP-binding protein [Candidatus Binatia bacterium]